MSRYGFLEDKKIMKTRGVVSDKREELGRTKKESYISCPLLSLVRRGGLQIRCQLESLIFFFFNYPPLTRNEKLFLRNFPDQVTFIPVEMCLKW